VEEPSSDRPIVVDAHVHVVAKDEAAYPFSPRPLSGPWYREAPHSAEDLLACMDEAGVERAVLVQPVGAYAYDNRYAADSAARHPARFSGVCCVDPEAAGAREQLHHWIGERGMRGVRLFALSRGASWLDDPRTFPLWELATELGAPLVVTIFAEQLPQLRRLLAAFPQAPVALDHCGFPALAGARWREAEPLFALADCANLHLKVSTHVLDAAARHGEPGAFVGELVARFGAERILWGSDFCQTHDRPYAELARLGRAAFAGLAAREQALCLGGNALRLWPAQACDAGVCERPGAPRLEPEARAGEPPPGELELADASPEELYARFAERGWGDGLPLVAPTPERVEAMLREGAGEPAPDPDAVIAALPPRGGLATRRLLAANAVLAGCPPGLLPVLVTAVRALARPELNLRGVNATTHPVAPLVIVHGAAAAALGFNAGLGAFGPGCRANATLGRAVRLVLLHVAGARPGDGDASTQGGPAKYAYCIAENAQASPWESYPRSRGIDAASAVTVHCGEAPHNAHDMESAEPAGILDKVASVVATLGTNQAPASSGEVFVVLGPEHAATIAAAGWTRGDVQSYLFERARLPARVLRGAFQVTSWRPWRHALRDEDLMPLADHPDHYRVLVAGGAGKHSCVIPSWGMTRSVTLPLEP